jgi:chemotaxis signal transduction protein
MATYKGISFPDPVAPLVRHMPAVDDHREALAALSATWDTLGLLAHLSDLKADMREVRASFGELTGELLRCLAEEMLRLAAATLGHQARIAVELLARSLGTRAAHVGLLAADPAVVQACTAAEPGCPAALPERLRAYAAHDTLCRDIVLMAPDGQVLGRLTDGFTGRSGAPLVERALASQGGAVHSGDAGDCSAAAPALTCACRVEHGGRAAGVLALSFDIEREARLIFERHVQDDAVLAFLDARGRVVVSNDAARLPRGRALALRPAGASVRLGGVTHVVAQRGGEPPRHPAWPGWSAVALAPVELAFGDGAGTTTTVTFSGENVLSQRLRDVPVRAHEIQRRLDRMVWNGRIHQASESNAFSRSLLEEISATGRKTEARFEQASSALLSTAVSGLQTEARLLAGLAADMLGRMLDECANDVRWWATDPALATTAGTAAREALARWHASHGALANAVLFDAEGVVIAASGDASVEGRRLRNAWVTQCLALRDPTRHAVSAFEATDLYGGTGTCVLAAPVLVDGQAAGGLALVLDAVPQFAAMLHQALPATPGAVAAFCLPDGHVVSRTGDLHVTLPTSVLSLAAGQSWSGLLAEGGQCFMAGAAATDGCRGFDGGGVEPVIAVVVIPCGHAVQAPDAEPPRIADVPGGVEIATFLIGDHLMGVPASEVVECIAVTAAVRVWRGGFAQRHVGFVTWNDRALPLVDIGAHVGAAGAAQRHAIVLRAGDQSFGLLVSELGPIADMKLSEERGLTGQGDLTKLISQLARSGSVIIPVLSPDAIFGGASG